MNDVDREVRKLKDQPELWQVDTKPDIDAWIAESHEAAVSVVYDLAILQAVSEAKTGEKMEPISLSTGYLKAGGQLARKRIVAAGLRLAKILGPHAGE